MAKLVDAPHSKCGGFGCEGSSPSLPIFSKSNLGITSNRFYAIDQINKQKIEVTLSVEDSQKIQTLSKQLGQSISKLSQEILHKYLKGELIERKQ